MQPTAIWIVYTLMFGYPVPTMGNREFATQSGCELYKHSLDERVVEAFKLVCSTR